jgi:hypothetical protein
MYLIQLLLPLDDNAGQPLPRELFQTTRAELVERFEGLTAYSGAPAEGVWQEDAGAVLLDRIVVFEIQVEALDREFWRTYRGLLEERFRQKSLLVRAIECTRL